jgi:hypothetical protein
MGQIGTTVLGIFMVILVYSVICFIIALIVTLFRSRRAKAPFIETFQANFWELFSNIINPLNWF